MPATKSTGQWNESSERPLFRVIKLGGTSVANADSWARFLEYYASIPDHTHTVLVCSAVGGVTNLLERIARQGGSQPGYAGLLSDIRQRHEQLLQALASPSLIDDLDPLFSSLDSLARKRPEQERDLAPWQARLLAFGELLSTTLINGYLGKMGLDPSWVDARRILHGGTSANLSRAQQYLSAQFPAPNSPQLQEDLANGPSRLSITQGFIGSNMASETVLLGRGGSDTSAAILASMLGAAELEIWTDVPGFHSADPRRVARTQLLTNLSYDEAAVLGALGAKILHPRCLGPLRDSGIPVSIKWSQEPDCGGTSIAREPPEHREGVKAVVSRHPLTLYSVRRPRRWQPVGFMSEVANTFLRHGLSMDLVSCSSSEIKVTVDWAAASSSKSDVSRLERDLASLGELTTRHGLSCVSLAGSRVSSDLARLPPSLASADDQRVYLISHAADDTHLSFVVDAEHEESLVRLLHSELLESARVPALDEAPRPAQPSHQPQQPHSP